MARFLLIALPLLVLLLALSSFVVEMVGVSPSPLRLFGAGSLLPEPFVLATWLLEALGLTALFLLVEGKSSFLWLDGLLTGWIAWVFRGPLLVITVVGVTSQKHALWWGLVLSWLGVYSLGGLLLALLARRLRRPLEPSLP